MTWVCEPLCKVEVSELAAWVGAIGFEAWPQQTRLADGKIRPAMAGGNWLGMDAWTDPVVRQVMPLFPGWRDYNRLISVVMAGHAIEPHCDPQIPQWRLRVHVPLQSNEQSRFIIGGVAHMLEPGTAYKVNTQVEHAVENHGDTPRVHFMWDVAQ